MTGVGALSSTSGASAAKGTAGASNIFVHWSRRRLDHGWRWNSAILHRSQVPREQLLVLVRQTRPREQEPHRYGGCWCDIPKQGAGAA